MNSATNDNSSGGTLCSDVLRYWTECRYRLINVAILYNTTRIAVKYFILTGSNIFYLRNIIKMNVVNVAKKRSNNNIVNQEETTFQHALTVLTYVKDKYINISI